LLAASLGGGLGLVSLLLLVLAALLLLLPLLVKLRTSEVRCEC
jgi:hypothetical protein